MRKGMRTKAQTSPAQLNAMTTIARMLQPTWRLVRLAATTAIAAAADRGVAIKLVDAPVPFHLASPHNHVCRTLLRACGVPTEDIPASTPTPAAGALPPVRINSAVCDH